METRNGIDKLAIFSGKPFFDEKLYVGRPNIGNRENFMARINDIFDRHWFTNNGQYVQEFERKLAEFIGVKHCIAMCNATIALEIVIRGLGLTGEVIVPSFTFVATPHSLQWQQITPVFCDIDPATHNLDPRRVEEMITPRTTGIIVVLWEDFDLRELRSRMLMRRARYGSLRLSQGRDDSWRCRGLQLSHQWPHPGLPGNRST